MYLRLIDHLRDHFTPEARLQGNLYLSGEKVVIDADGPGFIEARVDAERCFRIRLRRDEGEELRFGCDCEEFLRAKHLCAHLWAVLAKAELLQLPLAERMAREADLPEGGEAAELWSPPGPREAWKEDLDVLGSQLRTLLPAPWERTAAEDLRISYVIQQANVPSSLRLAIRPQAQKRLKSGRWGAPRALNLAFPGVLQPTRDLDREICRLLSESAASHEAEQGARETVHHLGELACDRLLPLLCASGRFLFTSPSGREHSLRWDGDEPWAFKAELHRDGDREEISLHGYLERAGKRVSLSEVSLLLPSTYMILGGGVIRCELRESADWLQALWPDSRIHAPLADAEAFEARVLELPGAARLLDLPGVERVADRVPQPRLRVASRPPGQRGERLECFIEFAYGELEVRAFEARDALRSADGRRVILRRPGLERKALGDFLAVGGHPNRHGWHECDGWIAPADLPDAAMSLLDRGWSVEAEGRRYRGAGALQLSVTTGIDWFDLAGGMRFDEVLAPLPQLFAAARRGERWIALGDGSVGLLPENWLDGWRLLNELGEDAEGGMRFQRNQAHLLDALLAELPEVDLDQRFVALRQKLRAFQGIEAQREGRSFQGRLREYQRVGLGWLAFLRGLGLGGCLADDMGLGKTIQVLALLEARRLDGVRRPPSLVVVPRSLVFNWFDEARRFTPRLKVLDYSGPRRFAARERFCDHHLIVTTYGTVRRDILELKDRSFDYVILDEAQAIKNASSQSAKAVRLLRAEHRLAMSGTPIENHLGELWSLFEFLNPGMLGGSRVLRRLGGGSTQCIEDDERGVLAAAMRPFFLRRTKEQVLADLPEKTEQVIRCELRGRQAREYEGLVRHYRAVLLDRAREEGLNRVKIHVLEALLRLRQAACHPGLIDEHRRGDSSAKLEALLPHLEEITASGHRALVFSQFTSFLSIVRARLSAMGLETEYLDGRTRDRKSCVDRFQSAGGPPVFLISLKAGGAGLNLTAADYVYLLDPWWNPAVEAQAIDRTHRIGQDKPVMAYRLIASNTVEEKVLELQSSKRELANAIINADNALLRDLTREDLERLLS